MFMCPVRCSALTLFKKKQNSLCRLYFSLDDGKEEVLTDGKEQGFAVYYFCDRWQICSWLTAKPLPSARWIADSKTAFVATLFAVYVCRHPADSKLFTVCISPFAVCTRQTAN